MSPFVAARPTDKMLLSLIILGLVSSLVEADESCVSEVKGEKMVMAGGLCYKMTKAAHWVNIMMTDPLGYIKSQVLFQLLQILAKSLLCL